MLLLIRVGYIRMRRRYMLAVLFLMPVISIVLKLRRFVVAVSWVSVNHDGRGGTAPDAVVWDQGGIPKRRRVDGRVNIDLASLPGPSNFLQETWMQVCSGGISGADIAGWPYSVDMLCKFTFILKSLRWPVDTRDVGIMVCPIWKPLFFESWMGHWLLSENTG